MERRQRKRCERLLVGGIMAHRQKIYAVYKGEQNLADGTADELAQKLGVKRNFIYKINNKHYLAKYSDKNTRLIAIKIED